MRVHAPSAQVPGADPRIYEEVSDMSQLQPTIEEYLNDYNAESKQPMPRVTAWTSTRESGCRDLGAAALVSAQTRARRLSDTLDRIERVATHYDRERPRIEAQLEP